MGQMATNVLKQTFLELLKSYQISEGLITQLWDEIEKSYSNKNRHYHTLHHLDNLLAQLKEVQPQIENWDTILFTLYYHDIIYNSLKSDNEEKSAALAEKRMKQISIPNEIIENCKKQILATKSHLESKEMDTNYFRDADLSILGQDCEKYSVYFKNVRKEYSIYPNMVYNPGRKKVLNHFLSMNRIFKTDYFFNKFEESAKQNLRMELDVL
jgi:predicted metal-dependent HD superfamily phosphohydrolase